MIFSSYQFILVFLPLCYIGFLLVHRACGWRGVYPYLALASLVFYAQWSPMLAGILAVSVVCNYGFGALIVRSRQIGAPAGGLTVFAVVGNLIALGYFKYANFLIDIGNSLSNGSSPHLDLIVPIGVSFYTFTQIGFLLEAYNGHVGRVSFARYAMFATFFPCVTAGPILQQREIFGQLDKKNSESAFSPVLLSVGLTLIGIGIFKKVILAESVAPYANAAFDGVAGGAEIGMVEAWVGAVCYTFQLFFDFSGYSDIAVGLGYMFGIKPAAELQCAVQSDQHL